MKKVVLVVICIIGYGTSFGQKQDSFNFRDRSDEIEVEVPEYVSKRHW